MSGRLSAAALVVACGALCAGCDYDDSVPPTATSPGELALDLTTVQQRPGEPCASEAGAREVFERNCVSCHNAERPRGGLDLVSPDILGRLSAQPSVHAECRDSPLIVPGRPDAGIFLAKLLGTHACGDPMPPRGTLTPDELQCVAQWIASQPEAASAPEL